VLEHFLEGECASIALLGQEAHLRQCMRKREPTPRSFFGPARDEPGLGEKRQASLHRASPGAREAPGGRRRDRPILRLRPLQRFEVEHSRRLHHAPRGLHEVERVAA